MARQVENVQALTLEEVLAELDVWEKDVAQTGAVLADVRDGKAEPETLYPEGEGLGRLLSREENIEWFASVLERDRAYVAELRARRDKLGREPRALRRAWAKIAGR